MNLIIRPEREADHYESEAMTRRAFWNLHFPGCDEHYLVHLLRGDPDYLPSLSRVAEVDGKVVGLIMYAKAKLIRDHSVVDVITFGPLCVDPAWQHRGVGGKLLTETLHLAEQEGQRGVIIFGEPGYYPRFGFRTCDQFGITTADSKNFDAFMGYELQPGGLQLQGYSFQEAPVYESMKPEDTEAYDAHFPHMEKLRLPHQWNF